ncbi:MAG: membrane protein insertase YidC [Polyangia bacterium]|jgi:YidC/Oxa1 family membrane protein insertase
MDKRLLLAVAVSIAIILLWWKIFPPPTPPARSLPPVAGESQPEPPSGQGQSDHAPGLAGPAAPRPSEVPAARAAEQLVTLESPDASYVFSSWGASLRHARLKNRQFLLDRSQPSSGIDIVKTAGESTAPLRTSFGKPSFAWSDAAAWSVERPNPGSVIFRSQTADVVVEKRYQLEPQSYRLLFSVAVQNRTTGPIDLGLAIHLATVQDPEKKGGGFFSYASANLAELVCYVNDKPRRSTIDSLLKERQSYVGAVRWIASGDKYFTLAAVPFPDNPPRERGCSAQALDPVLGEMSLSYATRTVPPGDRTEYPLVVFAGPKLTSDLEAVRPGGEDAKLADDVDVTFAVLSRPMLALLKQFYRLTGNWGVAIIFLTLFVRLVTFYPTYRQLVSGKKMQGLSDKVAALRKKYENDKQKLGVETMNLYKAHGVSPFGGCLPALIQMPIWIALFSTLNYAVELYRSSFFWYITDLSAKDPYYLAPLLMGSVMFMQMRMSPAGTDPQQQKMMSVMMPVMFTGFSLFLPAGLSIYTLTSYLFGILQQLYVNRRYPAPARVAAAKS